MFMFLTRPTCVVLVLVVASRGVSVAVSPRCCCPNGGVTSVLRVRLVQRLDVGQRARELRVIGRHRVRCLHLSSLASRGVRAVRNGVERIGLAADVKDEHGQSTL